MLRQYLLLVRLPNVFTAPSNILAGYFAVLGEPAEAGVVHLASAMAASSLLYIGGIVLNDYFDIDIDRKERPERPLPSGRVARSSALYIALAALAAANALVFAAGGVFGLAVSASLTGAIAAYDGWLKHGRAGAPVMAATRFLNVVLGATAALPLVAAAVTTTTAASAAPAPSMEQTQVLRVALAASALFLYVLAIMVLSRKEVHGNKDVRGAFIAAASIVASLVIVVVASGLLLGLRVDFLVSLAIFATAIATTFYRHLPFSRSPAHHRLSPASIQKTVRNMVISIVVLDSVFVSGTAGLPYGLATLLLAVPAMLLAKKLYVT